MEFLARMEPETWARERNVPKIVQGRIAIWVSH
eukprot:COSAG05_NODE_2268_length_3305_cov_7.375546_2_plen_33_part_00